MGHDWVFDVLRDLKDYAVANGLNGLAIKVDEALVIAGDEIGVMQACVAGDPPEGVRSH